MIEAHFQHPQIPHLEWEALVDRSRNALKTMQRDGYMPLRGRDIVSALALIVADDLVRTVGVDRATAARAAEQIAHAGQWWPDIMTGGRALLAKRHNTPDPERTPPRVLLAIVHEARQPEPVVFIGSLDSIYSELAHGDRFRAVSVTEAWVTLVERAAAARIDLAPYLVPLPSSRQPRRGGSRNQQH
jgi:hypothetical protein